MWKQTVVDGSLIFGGVILAGGLVLVMVFGYAMGTDSVLSDCKRYGKHIERGEQITCVYASTR